MGKIIHTLIYDRNLINGIVYVLGNYNWRGKPTVSDDGEFVIELNPLVYHEFLKEDYPVDKVYCEELGNALKEWCVYFRKSVGFSELCYEGRFGLFNNCLKSIPGVWQRDSTFDEYRPIKFAVTLKDFKKASDLLLGKKKKPIGNSKNPIESHVYHLRKEKEDYIFNELHEALVREHSERIKNWTAGQKFDPDAIEKKKNEIIDEYLKKIECLSI